jgi:phosphate-selective porin OprO/OprP
MQTDFVWYDQNEESKLPINTNNFPPTWTRDLEDGVEFRRARLYISGSVYDNIKFKWQYDFAQQDDDDDTEFKDVYVALTDLPVVGTLKIGHFKEPFSLEELTSSKNVTFMERALPNVYAPGRNTGFQLQNAFLDERLTAAVGVFRETNDWGFYADDDAGWNVTGRITGLPWYADEGRQLLHLGAAYSHKNPDDFGLRYRQRPEAHLSGIRFVDTAFQNPFPGAARVDSVNLYGGEAALVYGPFSVQGEYMMHDVDTDYSLGDLDFDGWYVETSYYLTGEHRRYDTGDGTFDSVKPLNNFSLDGSGWGAWQVALRYSTVDFNDGWVVRGGEETNWTAGINWWLNPATRVTFNYVKADIEHDLYEGDLDIFQTRFQFAF